MKENKYKLSIWKKFIFGLIIIMLVALFLFVSIFPDQYSKTGDLILAFKDADKANFDRSSNVDDFLNGSIFKYDHGKLKVRAAKIFANPMKTLICRDDIKMTTIGRLTSGGMRVIFKRNDKSRKNIEYYFKYKNDKNHWLVKIHKEREAVQFDIFSVLKSEQFLEGSFKYKIDSSFANSFNILFYADFFLIYNKDEILFQQRDKGLLRNGRVLISYNKLSGSSKPTPIKLAKIHPKHKKFLLETIVEKFPGLRDHRFQYGDPEWNQFYSDHDLRIVDENDQHLRRLKLGDAVMPAIYFKPGSSLLYKIVIPDKPVLEFSMTLTGNSQFKDEDWVFEVSVQTRDDEIFKSYKMKLSEYEGARGRFQDVMINLEEFANRDSKVRFSFYNTNKKQVMSNALLACGSPSINSKRVKEEFNVILISLDTLRADHLRCYGYFRPTSPNMDKFAAGNSLFLNSTSCSNWTMPSHMSMFTSLYPMETGFVRGRPPVRGMDFDKDVRTLAQYLKEYGYKTVGIHEGGFVSPDFGFDRGFDLFKESEKGADTTVDNAISFLDENRENKFFLFLHTYEVHAPYTHEYFVTDLKGGGNDLKASQIAKYDSGIRFTDEQIGRLINYLKETGLYEKTLIIITSDHGEHFDYEHEGLPGTHGWTLMDDETLVPLIIGGVDQFKIGKRVIFQASAVDIVPTILDLLGDRNDYTFRGRSLLPLLGNEPVKEKAAYSEATAAYAVEQKSIRMSQYKLTAFEKKRMPNSFTEDFNYHFVDLVNDSEEQNDVSRKYTSKYRAYKKILLGLVRKVREKQSDFMKTSERKSEIDSRLEDQLKALGYIN